MTSADVIVVGLGAMGSAALYQLARSGARVIGIDRFAPPHEHGSSHGETRITRQGIGEGEAYVPLALRSHEIWREIEAETGEDLFLACGGIVLAGAASRHPKKAAFLDKTISAAERYGIAHEILSVDEVRARYPQFILDGDERAYFEPGAGLLYPERCIAAQLQLAGRAGATIRTNEVVASVTPAGSGIRVETDRGAYEGEKVILTAGAWNPGLVGAPFGGLALHRQVLTWFEAEQPADYGPDRFPVFIWMHGSEGENSYGFPIPPGTTGVKVATESYEVSLASPEEIRRDIDPAETAAIYGTHVAGRLAGIRPRCVRAATCFYTQAPDARFIIDQHPESERIILVSACSGHGFKHSAAIGEALAQRALQGRSELDLTWFELPRGQQAA